MTEEIAKKASKFLKEKEDLESSLHQLKEKHYYIGLIQEYPHNMGAFNQLIVEKYSQDTQNKLKELLIFEINEKINKIDKELSELKCN